MIVLNTPHNPLGKMFSKKELEEIGRIAVKHDLIIVSDEVVLLTSHEVIYFVSYWTMDIYNSMIDWTTNLTTELRPSHLSYRVAQLLSGQRERRLDVQDGE